MHYLKHAFTLVIIATTTQFCTSQQTNSKASISKDCIDLNNKGVNYMANYLGNGDKRLDTALYLFKQAIKCDSNYLTAYINLANAYDHKHSYDEEIVIINNILLMTKNAPAMLIEKGMLFERKGNIDSATKFYYLAKVKYEKELSAHPDDINAIEGVVNLKALIIDKKAAMDEIKRQIKIHPYMSSSLSAEYEFYKGFNRRSYVFREVVETSSIK